jgi:glutaredoxin
MRIDVYTGSGCGHQDTTKELVEQALQNTGEAGAEVAYYQVSSPEEARSKRVIGSPTIRVNGVDVEYGDREPDETSPGCRYFATPEGWKPVPAVGMIVRAITVAREREGKAAG